MVVEFEFFELFVLVVFGVGFADHGLELVDFDLALFLVHPHILHIPFKLLNLGRSHVRLDLCTFGVNQEGRSRADLTRGHRQPQTLRRHLEPRHERFIQRLGTASTTCRCSRSERIRLGWRRSLSLLVVADVVLELGGHLLEDGYLLLVLRDLILHQHLLGVVVV